MVWLSQQIRDHYNQKLLQHLHGIISLNQWLLAAYSSDIFGGRGGDENCLEFAWVAVKKSKGSSNLHNEHY